MGVFVFNLFLIFFLFSCETKKKDDSDVLARVSGKTLTIKKAQKLNPGKQLNKETISKIANIPENTIKSDERILKLRCVEGWSMVIPWLGFSLSKLLNKIKILFYYTLNKLY